MSAATTTVKVGADTTDYMRKMQQVQTQNRRAGQSVAAMVPGLNRVASVAGIIATAASVANSSWSELTRRMRDAEGLAIGTTERLSRLLQGVGATQGGPQVFEDVRSAISTRVGAFAQRDDTPEQSMGRAIAALEQFANQLPGGATGPELIRGMNQIATAAERGLDPQAFASAIATAASIGISPGDRADFAATFTTAGGRGGRLFQRAAGEFTRQLRPGEEPTQEGFLEFFQGRFQRRLRGDDATTFRALSGSVESIPGAFARAGERTPDEFSRIRDPQGTAGRARVDRALTREDQAIQQIELESRIDQLEIGAAGNIALGLNRAGQSLGSPRASGRANPIINILDTLGFLPRPPRAMRLAPDPDERGSVEP